MAILENFVALDLETTGIEPRDNRIIEITALRVRESQVEDEFHSLVDPEMALPSTIERLTGISAHDLTGQPTISDVLPEFHAFVAGAPMVAHNAPFDVGFLRAADPTAEFTATYDTLELARIALPRTRNHKLETLAAACGIDFGGTHRAQDDATAVVELLSVLVDMLAAKPFGQLQALLGLAEGASHPLPPLAPVADLLRAIVEQAARRGLGDAAPPDIEAEHLVSLPNTLSSGVGNDERLDTAIEPQAVASEATTAFLGPGGALSEALEGFESRDSQIEMADAVCQSLSDGEILVCEAGTGTGKSLAYLVPAILWAATNGRRVVVSTNTKALQEQLFYKDLPLLAENMGVEFRASLLKGRSNYVCLNRWRSGETPGAAVSSERERESALPIATWIDETASGDISENSGFRQQGPGRSLWAKLSAEGQPCSPNACPCYNDCFLMRVRRATQQAHVVVINHSLLFSDLLADNAILGPYEDLIVDEAHNLEKVASEYLGAELSWWRVRDLLGRLYAREAGESGLLARINSALPKGSLAAEDVKSFQVQTARAIDAARELRTTMREFFDKLGELVERPRGRYSLKQRYMADNLPFGPAMDARNGASDAIQHLANEVGVITEWLRELEQGRVANRDELLLDLENRRPELEGLDSLLVDMTEATDEKLVYWYEVPASGSKDDVRLYSAPLHVAERLQETFFPSLRSVVLTSATLAVAGKFDYFLSRSGLADQHAERTRTLAVGSPFDYDSQAFAAVPKWLPSPKSRTFQRAVTELVRDLTMRVRRGTLVLFTSHRMLRDTYHAVHDELAASGILLLGQGIDGSRTNLADTFRREPGSVLFGTESFWQRVDMPAEALEMLVIVKLPFSVPTEPLVVAQAEELKRLGKDPFLWMTVPEAAIRFRQGFGRLIRSRRDRGAVVILDTRVATERFGRAFLKSLPTGHRAYDTSESLLSGIEEWFGQPES